MKLSRRETTFVGVGVIILAALVLNFLVIEPLAARRDRYREMAARMEADLAEMRSMAAQYQALAGQRDRYQRQVHERGGDFSPFSYLENLASESGLTGQIESMTPVATAAAEDGRARRAEFDLRLSDIRLLDLVRFLYRIESSEKVFFVINLNIKPRYLNPDSLDVTVRLATPAAS
ncbi:MAG: type II secretion system protein M [Proteobacteria bacterium]|nr:type II secretion system protein M [Pseudomonadota bacterium]